MRLDEVDYQLDEVKEVEILSKSGQHFENPAFISVMQENSKVGIQATLDGHREILELFQDKNNLEVSLDEKGNVVKDKNNEDVMVLKHGLIMKVAIKKLARITTGWRGISDENGDEIKFSFENALIIYEKYEHIANTVYQFSYNAQNYLGKSQPTSLPTQSKAVGMQPSQTQTKSRKKGN